MKKLLNRLSHKKIMEISNLRKCLAPMSLKSSNRLGNQLELLQVQLNSRLGNLSGTKYQSLSDQHQNHQSKSNSRLCRVGIKKAYSNKFMNRSLSRQVFRTKSQKVRAIRISKSRKKRIGQNYPHRLLLPENLEQKPKQQRNQ